MASDDTSAFSAICDRASALGLSIGAEELAAFASGRDLGGGEPAAIADLLAHLAGKRKESTIETLPGQASPAGAQDLRQLRLLEVRDPDVVAARPVAARLLHQRAPEVAFPVMENFP